MQLEFQLLAKALAAQEVEGIQNIHVIPDDPVVIRVGDGETVLAPTLEEFEPCVTTKKKAVFFTMAVVIRRTQVEIISKVRKTAGETKRQNIGRRHTEIGGDGRIIKAIVLLLCARRRETCWRDGNPVRAAAFERDAVVEHLLCPTQAYGLVEGRERPPFQLHACLRRA